MNRFLCFDFLWRFLKDLMYKKHLRVGRKNFKGKCKLVFGPKLFNLTLSYQNKLSKVIELFDTHPTIPHLLGKNNQGRCSMDPKSLHLPLKKQRDQI